MQISTQTHYFNRLNPLYEGAKRHAFKNPPLCLYTIVPNGTDNKPIATAANMLHLLFLPTSNFFVFFLLKSLYYQMIIRIFVATESATLPI